ncbi:hypothetical protein D3C73_1454590 [compost metagenome]
MNHSRLAGAVRCPVLITDNAVLGGNHDDRAVFLPDHAFGRLSGKKEGALQIGVDDEIPLFLR